MFLSSELKYFLSKVKDANITASKKGIDREEIFLIYFPICHLTLVTACGHYSHLSAPASKVQRQKSIKNNHYYSSISKKRWDVRNGKERIFGYLYQPQGSHTGQKVAILAHGLNGSCQEMQPYGKISLIMITSLKLLIFLVAVAKSAAMDVKQPKYRFF